jgi:CBS domain-containing protein
MAGQDYSALGVLRVADAMHHGLVSCSLDTPLRTVARTMATYRVHAVLVTAHGDDQMPGGKPWGIVSDLDVLRAAARQDIANVPARAVADTPIVMIAADRELAEAARLMTEREVSHLIVVEAHSGQPVGVVSTLDIARALAGFPERHPAG